MLFGFTALLVGLPSPMLQAQSNYATPYTFTTLAGVAPGSTDGTGAAARFNIPRGVAVDGSGNSYVADTVNSTIRKITPYGVVTTLAGSAGLTGGSDGSGSGARFDNPQGVAVDGSGNVYVADTYNSTIRKITPDGTVTTLAGTVGAPGHSDGTGSAATFYLPQGMVADGSGNVYVADTMNFTIRKITPGGAVTTLAGVAGGPGHSDGSASAARFDYPQGVALDGSGNVYVADSGNDTVRQITPGGVVTTLAGNADQVGSSDGTGSAAQFNYPVGVAVDGSGNVYVADTGNHTIRQITRGGVVTTLAGTAGRIGSSDGSGSAASFYSPEGVAVDGSAKVYVADTYNDTIRQITQGSTVSTFAGTATEGKNDGASNTAQFYFPCGVTVDRNGNTYVADTANQTIRKITSGGVVTTLAGTAGQTGSSNGSGSAALFNQPTGLAVDGSGNVYVADSVNQTIRQITPGGVVTTLSGTSFFFPTGVAVDGSGNVYVADSRNETIRLITPGGVETTLAGKAGVSGSSDGSGNTASFYNPAGVAVDGSGNVYVADQYNCTIRKITPGGVVTTLAGTAGQTGSSDGTGSAASFDQPTGVAVDGSGNVYVVDRNQTIRQITPDGVVTTLGGSVGLAGNSDGTGAAALFAYPQGVAVDGSGNVYVADTDNNTIRKGTPPSLDFFSGVVKPSGYKKSPWFGVYSYNSYPLVYEFNLGYEYAYDAGSGGVYLYDYSSGHFWYTQASYFPFVYDFSLNTFVYYYNSNTPHRHFYDYGTNAVITQ